MTDEMGQITRLAERWGAGDRDAFRHLVSLVYDDLHAIAHRQLQARRRDGGLDTTALVHEAYLKLAAVEKGSWKSRSHFFAFCSKAMRRILIDHARQRYAVKRGGDRVRVTLTPGVGSAGEDTAELLALNDALERLEARDPRLAQVVELRFFGGMSVPEAAEALEISTRTVERDWARARAYLHEALAGH